MRRWVRGTFRLCQSLPLTREVSKPKVLTEGEIVDAQFLSRTLSLSLGYAEPAPSSEGALGKTRQAHRGPETSPSRREAVRREQAERDSPEVRSKGLRGSLEGSEAERKAPKGLADQAESDRKLPSAQAFAERDRAKRRAVASRRSVTARSAENIPILPHPPFRCQLMPILPPYRLIVAE